MINMLRELEAEFGVRVAMRELFEDADTPARLADLIVARSTPGEPAPSQPAPAPPQPAPAPPIAAAPEPAATTAVEASTVAVTEAIEALARQLQAMAQLQTQMMAHFSQVVGELHAASASPGVTSPVPHQRGPNGKGSGDA
jgi:iturin family lipopeptide synthetase A